jgi:hypothetical protein
VIVKNNPSLATPITRVQYSFTSSTECRFTITLMPCSLLVTRA